VHTATFVLNKQENVDDFTETVMKVGDTIDKTTLNNFFNVREFTVDDTDKYMCPRKENECFMKFKKMPDKAFLEANYDK